MKALTAEELSLLEEEKRSIAEAQAGDPQALRPVFERLSPILYSGVILPRLGNEAEAEDVLKDTLMTAIRRLETFTWQGRSIYYWLRQIAVNKVIDLHRKNRNRTKMAERLANEADVHTGDDLPADEALIAQQERVANRERITATLEQINPRYARAIQLRLLEELPRRECAERMEVTIGTFDVLFFRAVKSFRKAFLALEDE